jgi:arylsulfatase
VRKPNVILIMADDLGYHDLGSYGHPSMRTPVLDQLGKDGIRLSGYYSGATVCTPSRMALLTGIYPVRLGWTQGVIGYKMSLKEGLNPDALTIAEIFRSEGYATGLSGKWHLGNQPDTRPHRQGFDDTYYIPLSNNQTTKVQRGDEVVEDPFDNRKLTEQFTNEAIRFIRAQAEKPFFLYLPYSAPHFPVQPHPEWKGKSAFGDYGDVVEELDARIGEILDVLAELKIADDTIVVFTSDNGPNPGEKADSLPFRGEKWSALEGGTRVPCLIRWPGTIPKGQESDATVCAMDLLPTLCRAAGIDWESKVSGSLEVDGRDVWEMIMGRGDAPSREELLYWHGLDSKPQAIRIGDWKLFFDRRHALEGSGTRRKTPAQAAKVKAMIDDWDGDPGAPLLFNLRDDPGETVDLSLTSPERVKLMQQRAEVLRAGLADRPGLELAKPLQ